MSNTSNTLKTLLCYSFTQQIECGNTSNTGNTTLFREDLMGLMVECPECGLRWSLKRDVCSCGFKIKKAASKVYWVEYYDERKRRRREKVGRSKLAAEQRLRNIQTAKAEQRELKRSKGARVTLGELRDWYFEQPEVQLLRSLADVQRVVNRVVEFLGEDLKVSELSPERLDSFRKMMRSSLNRFQKPNEPSTVNRHTDNFKSMLSRAQRAGVLEFNPLQGMRRLKECNVREALLTNEQFEHLLELCEGELKSMVLIAYYQAMRKGEILQLQWEWVDWEASVIRIPAQNTKNSMPRPVTLHPRVLRHLQGLGGHQSGPVFTRRTFDEKQWRRVRTQVGLEGMTFHDLRHVAINNLRLCGNDHYTIMRLSGHKTDSAFRRYNVVTDEELKGIKWGH